MKKVSGGHVMLADERRDETMLGKSLRGETTGSTERGREEKRRLDDLF